MTNTLFLTTVAVESNLLLLLFFIALANIRPGLSRAIRFIQIFGVNDELKTTYNTFLDCQVHSLFLQPLEMTVDGSRVC